MDTVVTIVKGLIDVAKEVHEIREAHKRFPEDHETLELQVVLLLDCLETLKTSAESFSEAPAHMEERMHAIEPLLMRTLNKAKELMNALEKPQWFVFNHRTLTKDVDRISADLRARRSEVMDFNSTLQGPLSEERKTLLEQEDMRRENELRLVRFLETEQKQQAKALRSQKKRHRRHFRKGGLLEQPRRAARRAHYMMKRAERRARRFFNASMAQLLDVLLGRIQERLTEERLSESMGAPSRPAVEDDDERQGLLDDDSPEDAIEEEADRITREHFAKGSGPFVVWMACYAGDTDLLSMALGEGFEVNLTCPGVEPDEYYRIRQDFPDRLRYAGATPFLVACMRGHLPVVQMLLDVVPASDKLLEEELNGLDAEELAGQNGHTDVAAYLAQFVQTSDPMPLGSAEDFQ
mmetsp:Transcript_15428/g.58679  ORF Transcript_15428/g.58679 Transcript_15428/m.58679 type:complete len:408 (-) Transcript_15428:171-1394(-)